MKTQKHSSRLLMLLVLFFLGSLVGCTGTCQPKPDTQQQGQNDQQPEKTPIPITDEMITSATSCKPFLGKKLQELQVGDVTKINARDTNKYKTTALMYAAAIGDLEILQALLDRGADVAMLDDAALTALAYAIYYRKCEAAILLAQKMSTTDLDLKNIYGKTAYQYANGQITQDPAYADDAAQWQAVLNALKAAGADTTL